MALQQLRGNDPVLSRTAGENKRETAKIEIISENVLNNLNSKKLASRLLRTQRNSKIKNPDSLLREVEELGRMRGILVNLAANRSFIEPKRDPGSRVDEGCWRVYEKSR